MASSLDSDEGMNLLLHHFSGVLQGGVNIEESEAALNNLSAQPGFGVALAKLALSPGVPGPARQFSSVLLKQFVAKHWVPSDDENSFVIPDPDKAVLKENMTIGLHDSIRSIRTATAYVVSTIAFYEWPENWPNLFEGFIENLQSGDPNAVHGTLRCLAEFAKDMSGNHMPTAIPILFPELARILANEQNAFTLRDQMRAVSIFTTCLKCVYMTLEEYGQDAVNLISSHVPLWINQFIAILSDTSVGEGTDCGLKIEVMNALTLLVKGFYKYMGDLMDPVFPHIWQTLVAGQPAYERLVLSDEAAEFAQDSDGDALGFEFLVCVTFEFITQCVKIKKYRKRIKPTLDDLARVVIFYVQVTADQLEMWSNDPDQYVQDEDEDVVKAHSVRVAADDLLLCLVESMVVGPAFARVAVTAIVGAVGELLERSSAQRESGDERWWRLREAAFYTMGRISEDLLKLCEAGQMEFDLNGFLANVLLPDLNMGGASPFFLGRALWLASFFAGNVPTEVSTDFLQAAVTGIDASNPTPIRICACQALAQFAPRLPPEVMLTVLVPIIEGAVQLAQEWPTESGLILSLTVLSSAIGVDKQAIVPLEGTLIPFIIAVWLRYPASHRIAADLLDIIDTLCGNPGMYPHVVRRFLPTLVSVLNADAEAVPVPGFKAVAVDVIATMIDTAPDEQLPDIFLSEVFPAVCTQIMDTEDYTMMQSGSEILRAYVRRASPQLCQSFNGGPTGLQHILAIVERILETASEDGATMVGGLITGLMKRCGNDIDQLPAMLTACVERLAVAQYTTFIQSLVIVFAQLVNIQSPTMALDFLSSIRVNDGRTGVEVVMNQWVDHEPDFYVDYEIKVSIVALTKFLVPPDPRIAELPVQGDENVGEGIMTRSRRQGKSTRQVVPFPVRVFSLLLAHVREQVEQQNAGGDDVTDEDDDFDDDEEAGYLDHGEIGKLDPNSPFAMLSDMIGMGLDLEKSEDDPDAKDDPINEYNILEYLTAFFKQFSQQSPDVFNAYANGLNELDQHTLRQLLNS